MDAPTKSVVDDAATNPEMGRSIPAPESRPVTPSARGDCEMRVTLPASVEAIEGFFMEFRRRSQALLDRANWFAAELLVREAVTNAVVHGCHGDPSKQVRCTLRLRNQRLFIAVQDVGEGFDWRAVRSGPASFQKCSGRGLALLWKYANRVRYNDRGNAVALIKRF